MPPESQERVGLEPKPNCTKCGAPLPSLAKFCSNCGKKTAWRQREGILGLPRTESKTDRWNPDVRQVWEDLAIEIAEHKVPGMLERATVLLHLARECYRTGGKDKRILTFARTALYDEGEFEKALKKALDDHKKEQEKDRREAS